MKLLPIIFTACALCACESAVDPSKGRFLTNDRGTIVPPPRLAEISQFWKADPAATFGSSNAGKVNTAWTFEFIAVTEAGGISPCKSLTPVRMQVIGLAPFTIFDAAKNERRTYQPTKYHEAWFVDACGKVREWRVFDDPSYKGDPHTVILWRAA